MQCPGGRAVGVFAVAKLVKLICLTKFYDPFLSIVSFFIFFLGIRKPEYGCFQAFYSSQLLIAVIISVTSDCVSTGEIGKESSLAWIYSVTG